MVLLLPVTDISAGIVTVLDRHLNIALRIESVSFAGEERVYSKTHDYERIVSRLFREHHVSALQSIGCSLRHQLDLVQILQHDLYMS